MFDNSDFYVIFNKMGQPIGIDTHSGGYPYVATHPKHVEYFDSYQKADQYRNVMNESEWTIHEAEFVTMEATPPDAIVEIGQVWENDTHRIVITDITSLRCRYYATRKPHTTGKLLTEYVSGMPAILEGYHLI